VFTSPIQDEFFSG